ncbi:hypothetical protein [Niabella ginsengisoli]|uniref:Uncharacterized protein n=1 Tax=Niabella ginsengisoli TaxID=522298 RepID=A0ABS9SJ44_9BACT|nr:hypothetical protein [Niabella ginsengisoli]MCH5598367.1 hypothetical protein [Niabella ginsengisoli]
MSQSNQCKIEFYFTRENIEQLLKENPKANGIIICQEIKVRHTADNEKVNVIEIKAIADNGKNKTRSLLSKVNGCPYPPGCGAQTEVEK